MVRRIPEVARRLGLDPARLGLGIRCAGLIGFAMQPLAAIAHIGRRRATVVLFPLFVIAQAPLIAGPSQPPFFVLASSRAL